MCTSCEAENCNCNCQFKVRPSGAFVDQEGRLTYIPHKYICIDCGHYLPSEAPK